MPDELRALGRRHGPRDVADTVAAARDAGIASVSLDLLYDVPGQTLASWTETLEAALALGPDHVSAYALTLDDPDAEGLTGPAGDHLPTPSGARRWRESARAAQDEDRAAGAYGLADALFEASGYPWYELSNWARPGHESRHNLVYWERRPYEAVGPGAHAFDGASRRWNARAPRRVDGGARAGVLRRPAHAAARRLGAGGRGGSGRGASLPGSPPRARRFAGAPCSVGSTCSRGRPSTAWWRKSRPGGSASRSADGSSPTSCSPALSRGRAAGTGRPARLTPVRTSCYDPSQWLALYR